MKFLQCILCDGELELVNTYDHNIQRQVKCLKCGFDSSLFTKPIKEPEITIIRKQNQ